MIQDIVQSFTGLVFSVTRAAAAFLTPAVLEPIFKSLIIFIIVLIARKIAKRSLARFSASHPESTAIGIAATLLRSVFWVICVMLVLNLFGIKLTALFGAAGVAGIAIGFAAQTSISNVISGFFVLTEKSIKPGDYIQIGATMGTVDAVDFLAIKIKTSDGQMVRIPSETVVKSNMTNFSYFPLRRISYKVLVSHDVELQKAFSALTDSVKKAALIVAEPAPSCIVESPDALEQSYIPVIFTAWCKTADFTAAQNEAACAIQSVLAEYGNKTPAAKFDVMIS